MNNNEEFQFPRLPGETSKAFAAKVDYVLMGESRSLEKLLEMYRGRFRDKSGSVPSKNKNTIGDWSSRWGWVALAAEFDEYQGDLLLQQQLEARQAEFSKALEEFRFNNAQLGKGSFKLCGDVVKELMDFVKDNPTIKDWDSALKASTLLSRVWPIADLWAKALTIEKMLSRYGQE